MHPQMSYTMTPLLVQILAVPGHPALVEHRGAQKTLEPLLEQPSSGLPATFQAPF